MIADLSRRCLETALKEFCECRPQHAAFCCVWRQHWKSSGSAELRGRCDGGVWRQHWKSSASADLSMRPSVVFGGSTGRVPLVQSSAGGLTAVFGDSTEGVLRVQTSAGGVVMYLEAALEEFR